MAKAIKKPATKTKKSLQKEVAGTLTEIFTDIKELVGKKKFGKKVKKASKILSAGALKKKEKTEKAKKDSSKKVKAVKAPKKAAKPIDKKVKKLATVATPVSTATPEEATN